MVVRGDPPRFFRRSCEKNHWVPTVSDSSSHGSVENGVLFRKMCKLTVSKWATDSAEPWEDPGICVGSIIRGLSSYSTPRSLPCIASTFIQILRRPWKKLDGLELFVDELTDVQILQKYLPGTQMTLVLIIKDLVFEVPTLKTRDKWVPGKHHHFCFFLPFCVSLMCFLHHLMLFSQQQKSPKQLDDLQEATGWAAGSVPRNFGDYHNLTTDSVTWPRDGFREFFFGGGHVFGCPPVQDAIVPTGIFFIFRIGDPELNLHLPLLLGGGTTQVMSNQKKTHPKC